MSMEDQHLEEAYEDRYTTSADWEIEDEIDQDEEDEDDEDEDEELEPERPHGYQGQHRAGVL